MKKLILLTAASLLAFGSYAGIYIQYENKDSEAYTFKVSTCGSTTEVKFEKATSAVTIQSGCDKCIIETKCGKIEVKNNAKVVIKDGCIKVTN